MQELSKPVKPVGLGVVGHQHLTAWMVRYAGVTEESVRYVRRCGDDGMPFVVETAFGVRGDRDARRIVSGLNWSPALEVPIPQLTQLLGEMRCDHHDPITVVVHVARPRFEFADHGKTMVRL